MCCCWAQCHRTSFLRAINSTVIVPSHSRLVICLRVVLLPLALSLATVAGLGSYCETSDDTTLAWLFSGILAVKPVASVPLYLHGYGHLLAAAYSVAPGVPWLGLLLGGLLSGATVLAFAVLDRLLRPWLRPLPLTLVLGAFFSVVWIEHWLWFSHARVALLLAGAALLYAAQRPGRTRALLLGLAGLGAAWLLRPSFAVLALGATLPAVLLLAGQWRRAVPLLLLAGLGLVFATGTVALLRTPAETQNQVQDGYFARILDFNQLQPQPRTPADSLGTTAIPLWLLGDDTIVNEALCRRAYRFDSADFFGQAVPAKLGLRFGLLARDYFPLLLALLVSAVAMLRRWGVYGWFSCVQLGFLGMFVVFAGLLKLPPRLALPLLDFWLLTNLAFWLRPLIPVGPPIAARALDTAPLPFSPLVRWLGTAVALVVFLAYGAKTLHRRQVLGQERSRHERALAEISQRTGGSIRVLAGTSDLLKSLSPFRGYSAGAGPVVLLTGWSAHDPSQPRLRQYLAGTRDQTTCLRRLAAPARNTQWLLTAETAQWLNRRFRYQPGPGLRLEPLSPLAPDSVLRFYRPVFY